MSNKTCDNCKTQYGVTCTETMDGGRDIRGRANFHGIHSIDYCKSDLHHRLFLTLITPIKASCNIKPNAKDLIK